ncbi:MAG: hypothetical protein OFPII_38110 [Osedax symbiont Rs1]|nr:MAG: hypothetical protein OFPII_38110 [Osedax symbiont Rs1]
MLISHSVLGKFREKKIGLKLFVKPVFVGDTNGRKIFKH